MLENISETEELNIPEEVNEETAKTVEELVKYFARQRSVMNKVIFLYSTFLVEIGQLVRNWNSVTGPVKD